MAVRDESTTVIERARDWESGGLASAVDCRCETESVKDELDGQVRLARLVRTIESEIVPRLVASRRMRLTATTVTPRCGAAPDEVEVNELVRLLLAHETGVASAFVQTISLRGTTLETICLDLLAPAARELGLLWEEDECDFMQVTVGLCRLHQVLRELSPAFASPDMASDGSQRILIAAYPREQHTFGVTLVAQFLRRAGWHVWQEYPDTTTQLIELARETSFAAIGLSVGSEVRLEGIRETIRGIRAASRNRKVGILIGGPICTANPDLAMSLGADAGASDGRDAVRQAQRFRADEAIL